MKILEYFQYLSYEVGSTPTDTLKTLKQELQSRLNVNPIKEALLLSNIENQLPSQQQENLSRGQSRRLLYFYEKFNSLLQEASSNKSQIDLKPLKPYVKQIFIALNDEQETKRNKLFWPGIGISFGVFFGLLIAFALLFPMTLFPLVAFGCGLALLIASCLTTFSKKNTMLKGNEKANAEAIRKYVAVDRLQETLEHALQTNATQQPASSATTQATSPAADTAAGITPAAEAQPLTSSSVTAATSTLLAGASEQAQPPQAAATVSPPSQEEIDRRNMFREYKQNRKIRNKGDDPCHVPAEATSAASSATSSNSAASASSSSTVVTSSSASSYTTSAATP